jgi:hypothetical protein
MRFKDWESYRKWLAYGHIHGVFEKAPGHVEVFVGGKKHSPKHTRKKR